MQPGESAQKECCPTSERKTTNAKLPRARPASGKFAFSASPGPLHSKLQFLLGDVPVGVWPGQFFHFWSVVRSLLWFSLSFWFSFIFSVTVPGTNAPRSAVTRSKPSLFSFSCFQGSLRPRFLALHLDYLRSVLFGFSCGFLLLWCVVWFLGDSLSAFFEVFCCFPFIKGVQSGIKLIYYSAYLQFA